MPEPVVVCGYFSQNIELKGDSKGTRLTPPRPGRTQSKKTAYKA
jgi:hypothetical protein